MPGHGHVAECQPAERIRVVAKGKLTAAFNGELYVRERWLKADLSIVKPGAPTPPAT